MFQIKVALVPVVGENVFDGDSAFLRVSLLPIDLIGGKSSFMPASDADVAKFWADFIAGHLDSERAAGAETALDRLAHRTEITAPGL